MYKVSAIIPAYNSQNTIIDCLNSVVNQTIKIDEIIIVDDGSTDNTVKIVLNYIDTHHSFNIMLFKQPNSGPSSARNLGIEKANGDLIAFLDSDDYWISEKTELQIKYLRENKDIILIGSRYSNVKRSNFEVDYCIVNFNKLLWKNCFSTSSVIVKKEHLLKNNFDENQKYSEDYGLWLKISLYGKCILLNNTVTIANKPAYGHAGLSANLWKMEKGELKNYKDLFLKRNIKMFQIGPLYVFSLLKFMRRYIISFNYRC